MPATPRLQEHPLIQALVTEPACVPAVRVVLGYLGRGEKPGLWRAYTSGELREYYEFHEDAVLHSRPAGPGSLVWLRADAPIRRSKLNRRRTEGDFLQGPISDQNFPRLRAAAYAAGADCDPEDYQHYGDTYYHSTHWWCTGWWEKSCHNDKTCYVYKEFHYTVDSQGCRPGVLAEG